MSTPPLLLAATLLFWGWQTGWLPLAALLAILLESSRLVRARWEISQADLDRIWNLCTLLFLGAAVYAFTAGDGTNAVAGSLARNNHRVSAPALTRSVRAVFLFFQWMPLYFIPMMATQAWGQREGIPLSTFSWWLRRQRREASRRSKSALSATPSSGVPASPPFGERVVNISYSYLAVCILGASAARARSAWFLAMLMLLLAWALWGRRSRSFSPWAWAGSLGVAVALGWVTREGLFIVEEALQKLDNALVARFSQGRSIEANETRTMLGAVGNLKLSGRIVLRVNSGDQPPPPLLRENSFNLFKSPVWASSKRDFGPLIAENDESTWLLLTNQSGARSVTIAGLLHGGRGLLPLPQGVGQLARLPVFLLGKNRLGTVRSDAGPGFVEFDARYFTGAAIDDPPGPEDLQVPTAEKPALVQITAELKLKGKPGEEAVRSLSAFFSRHFEYSAWLGEEPFWGSNRSPLSQFLLQRRKGHCEYFATATALLLRQAGIPARYATGYAVEERKGREYVVRGRHAHAWCLAWVNGAWREVDTTPGSWETVEAGRASFFEPLSDAWSRLWFEFSKWRWGQSQFRRYLAWLIAVPLFVVAGRLISTKGWRRSPRRGLGVTGVDGRPGLDSEFYLIQIRLAQLGLERRTGETASSWLGRIGAAGAAGLNGLKELLALHYRLRFDPQGLAAAERAALRHQVQEWLLAFEQQGPDIVLQPSSGIDS